MKRIFLVCGLALWNALNSQQSLATAHDSFSSRATPDAEHIRAELPMKAPAGGPLSLNFQDIEVRAALQLLADFAGLNLVVSDAVQGSITLNLRDVPRDQALDLVLKSKKPRQAS
ncbi:hypothetical protein [Pseudomonas taetrolens]|uniref:hypothetical protein n=1 Tax=Pseudomonas taetrolens TaxID=47884 RepID=UPI003F9861E9